MPEVCPKCGVVNPTGRSTCVACGAELEIALFAGMFGPPERLKGRYVIERRVQHGARVSLYRAVDILNHNQPCLVHQIALSSVDLDVREILEHRFAQLRTVEAAIGIQYLLTKTGDDLAQRGLAGFDQFAAEDIRVDDLCAEAGEMIAGGRLAAADSPGQADFEQLQPNPASCR